MGLRRFWRKPAPPAPAAGDPLRGLAFDDPGGPIGSYLLEGLAKIEGWGANPFTARIFLILDAAQSAAGVTGHLFELGVHYGRSAILFALMARAGEHAVFLDLFDDQDANLDRSGEGNEAVLRANLARWAPGTPVEIVQGNSLETAFENLPHLGQGTRLAHIDGGHHLEAVQNDLEKTDAVLAEGGIIVMDDFLHSGFPEVNEACNRYLAATDRLVPIALGRNKLVLCRPSHAEGYHAHLAGHLTGRLGKRVRFHGAEALCLDIH